MNRTGTYVAFDGLGQSDPTKSDFKYYATLQAWTRNVNIDFRFTEEVSPDAALLIDSMILGLTEIQNDYGNEFLVLDFKEV